MTRLGSLRRALGIGARGEAMGLSLSGRVTADSITGCVHFSPVFTDAEGRDDNEGMRFELIQQGGVWSITSIR